MLINTLELDSAVDAVQVAWAMAAAEIFLYGAYLVMVGFYMHVLRKHRMRKQRFLTGATLSLFVLSTLHCALIIASTVIQTRCMHLVDSTYSEDWSVAILRLAAGAIYVTSNVIADAIFVFRCYAIWNFQWKIIFLPTILTLAVAGFGYSNLVVDGLEMDEHGLLFFSMIAISASLSTTFVLMGLSVGRIWWLARAARKLMGGKVADRYRTVSAMILESGALCLVGGITFLVVATQLRNSDSRSFVAVRSAVAGPVLAQIVTIAPTIIAVRVGLGYSVESVESFIAPQPPIRPIPQPARLSSGREPVDEMLYIYAADFR